MGLWKLRSVRPAPIGVIEQKFIDRVTVGEELKVVPRSAKDVYPPAPSEEMFTLDARLKSGLPLTEVDSMLLDVPANVVDSQLEQLQEDLDKLDNVE